LVETAVAVGRAVVVMVVVVVSVEFVSPIVFDHATRS
jgi:hypothetical protein